MPTSERPTATMTMAPWNFTGRRRGRARRSYDKRARELAGDEGFAGQRLISKEDSDLIAKQLGFVPSNVAAVASRADTGEPTVLKLYPLAVSPKGVRAGNTERQPFPTMYWLSCPALKATISHLEKNGLVVEWEKRLQGNQESLIAMEKAHKEYAEERWSMLTDEDMAIVRRNRWDQALGLTSGVAGINKPATIKCLHTHFAHFLATGENLVGKWVHDALVARAEGGAATGGEGAEGSSTRP